MAGAVRIRKGTAADSGELADLMNQAGEGIPVYLWSQMAGPDVDPMTYGAQRVRRREGAFSYRNIQVATVDGALAGMLLAYRLPDPYDLAAADECGTACNDQRGNGLGIAHG